MNIQTSLSDAKGNRFERQISRVLREYDSLFIGKLKWEVG